MDSMTIIPKQITRIINFYKFKKKTLNLVYQIIPEDFCINGICIVSKIKNKKLRQCIYKVNTRSIVLLNENMLIEDIGCIECLVQLTNIQIATGGDIKQ